MKSGIRPVNATSEENNIFMFCSLANDGGIAPLTPELSIQSSSSLVQFPSSDGKGPEKLHVPRASDLKSVSMPSSLGSSPDKALIPMLKYCIRVRLAMEGGRLPVK